MSSILVILLLAVSLTSHLQASGCIPENPPQPEVNALSPHEGGGQSAWTQKAWDSLKGAASEVTDRMRRTVLRERVEPQHFPMNIPPRLQSLPIFKPEYTTINSTVHYANYLEETNCDVKTALAREISRHILDSPPDEMRKRVLEIRLVTEQMREQDLLTDQNRADIDELNKQLVSKIQIQEEWSENKKRLMYATMIGGMALVASLPSATSFRLLATKTADLFSPIAREIPALERSAALDWLAALDEGANTGNWARAKALREKAIPMPEISDELKIQFMERGRQTKHAERLLTLLEQAPPPPGMNRIPLWDTYVAFYSLKGELPHGVEYFEKMIKDITRLPDLGGVQLKAIESERELVDFIFARDSVSLTKTPGATHHGQSLPLNQVPVFLQPKPTNIEGVYSYVFNTGDGVRVALRIPRTAEEQALARSIYPKIKDKFDGLFVGIKRVKTVRLPAMDHGPTASVQMIYESANEASRANMKRIAERVEASLDESLSVLSAEGVITPTGLRLQQLTNSQINAIQAISGGVVGLGAATALDNYNLMPGEERDKLTRAELAEILENGLTPLQSPSPANRQPSTPVTPTPEQ